MSTTESNKLGIHFGAMVDPIAKQLKDQKLKFNKEEIRHFEKDHDAINCLKVRNILPSSLVKKAQDNLFNKIMGHIRNQNIIK